MQGRLSLATILLIAFAVVAHGQTSQPSPAAVDATTPRGALKALAMALDSGDEARIRELMNVTSPMEQKMVQATSQMAGSISGLKHAMTDKFGITAAQNAMGDSPDNLQKSLSTIDAAAEKIDGDLAHVSIPAARESMTLKKINGVWKISVAQQVQDQNLTPQQVDEKLAMVTAESTMLKEMTADVTAGKFATANDTAIALRAKMSGSRETTTSPASQH